MEIIHSKGLRPENTRKLGNENNQTIKKLLNFGVSQKDREEIYTQSCISETLSLIWVNLSNLMPLMDTGKEYSDLLEKAGKETIKELRSRNPENLFQAHQGKINQKNPVHRSPAKNQVINRVKQAIELPPLVMY